MNYCVKYSVQIAMVKTLLNERAMSWNVYYKMLRLKLKILIGFTNYFSFYERFSNIKLSVHEKKLMNLT